MQFSPVSRYVLSPFSAFCSHSQSIIRDTLFIARVVTRPYPESHPLSAGREWFAATGHICSRLLHPRSDDVPQRGDKRPEVLILQLISSPDNARTNACHDMAPSLNDGFKTCVWRNGRIVALYLSWGSTVSGSKRRASCSTNCLTNCDTSTNKHFDTFLGYLNAFQLHVL
jgi:hypothetical protein